MTNKVLLILGLFFVGTLGVEVCGPQSCNDLEVAKSCNYVQDCIDNVWSHIKPTGVRDNVCDICMKMVTEARDQLQSNETKEELREVLEGSCKLLLVKPAVKMCMKLADEFVPELVAMLSSQMDPEVVCSVAKLCNNAEIRAAITEADCSSCQNYASIFSSFMNAISEAKFKDEVIRACRSMGSYSDACFYYASMSSGLFYNQTKFALTQKPCEILDVCPKNYVDKTNGKEKSNMPWILAQKKLCVLCPEISSTLSRKIKSYKDPEEFKEKALEVCNKVSVSQDECRQEVKRYYSTIYYWLSQDVDTSFLCKSLMCRSATETAYPIWPLLPASIPEKKEPTLVSVSVAKDSSNVRVVNNGNRLKLSEGDPVDASSFALPLERFAVRMNEGKEVCKRVFDSLAENAADDDYVRQVLAPVCSDMDDTEKCRDFLNAHSLRLSSIFTKREIPEMICPEISKQDLGSSNEVCNVCVKAFEKLNEGLKNEAFKGKFGTIIGSVCNTVPKDSREMCHSFIDTFMQKTLSSVSSGNETKTCAFLKLCESPLDYPVIPSPVVSEKGKVGKESCQICLMVTQTVIDELTDKSNEDEIRKILMGVCNKLPAGVKKACDNVVTQYANDLIDLIAHGLNPNEICTRLHLCKRQSSVTEVVTVSQNKETVENSKIPCNICLTAMKMLINWVENNKTEEAIRNYISQVCSYMPEETRDTCQNLIEQYADDIIDMLVADFNATEVCIFLKVCGPKTFAKSSESPATLKSFDVGTNEVRDTYSSEGVCEFCRKVENSKDIKGNEENAAETLMALLMEVCILNVGDLNLNCEKMVSEKVLPFGRDAIISMTDVCESFNICPKEKRQEDVNKRLLMQIHAAVEECAMCESIVSLISNHEEMMSKHYNFAKNASLACSFVPKNRLSMCESMLISYGPSIVNLIVDKKVETSEVCVHLTLCDESQQTKVIMPVSDIEQGGIKTRPDLSDCKKGPAYWCSSAENAKKCGTYPHCQEMVWKDGVPPK